MNIKSVIATKNIRKIPTFLKLNVRSDLDFYEALINDNTVKVLVEERGRDNFGNVSTFIIYEQEFSDNPKEIPNKDIGRKL